MAALTSILLGAAALAGTAATLSKGRQEEKQAANVAADQARTQERLNQEFLAQTKVGEKPAEGPVKLDEVSTAAKAKQKARVAAASGRGSTILTSPLGVLGEASTQRKTLLGA
jgi:predicted DNA-binding transcriptional regulator YafY